MKDILIAYSTTDGHTREICQYMQNFFAEKQLTVQLMPINEVSEKALNNCKKIVVGASIRYGKHHKKVYEFIERHELILQQKSSAFFSVNVVARKPEKNQPNNNPYLCKFLKQIAWSPDRLAVFAGKIDYQKYGFFDRQMIRLIMLITNGPTDLNTVVDFTNWQQVEHFCQVINEM